jgi:hypothetical protein
MMDRFETFPSISTCATTLRIAAKERGIATPSAAERKKAAAAAKSQAAAQLAAEAGAYTRPLFGSP